MKDNGFNDQEFQELLKKKMNELSDSVDCFDKISARAFPKDQLDFSDGEFTVSDLENVTGRKRRLPALKWAAFGAAAAVCLAIIPKTDLTDRLFANLGSSSGKHKFQALAAEIAQLSERDDFVSYDVTLAMYSAYDVLVTPGISCPFEESGEENSMVRIFVRTIGGIPTNQLYAVEYEGTYAEENIIAAAESNVSISQEEAAKTGGSKPVFTYDDLLLTETVRDHFTADGKGDLLDAGQVGCSVASFRQNSFFKDENGIRPVTHTVLYGQRENSTDDSFFYDIRAEFLDESKSVSQEDTWLNVLYYNGRSAKPDRSSSHFSYEAMFDTSDSSEGCWAYFTPFSADSGRVSVKSSGEKIGLDSITYGISSGLEKRLPTPLTDSSSLSMRIFIDPYVFTSADDSIKVMSALMSSPADFYISDMTASEDIQQRFEELNAQSALEAQNAAIQAEIDRQRAAENEKAHLEKLRANEALIDQVLAAKEAELYKLG